MPRAPDPSRPRPRPLGGVAAPARGAGGAPGPFQDPRGGGRVDGGPAPHPSPEARVVRTGHCHDALSHSRPGLLVPQARGLQVDGASRVPRS